MKPKQPFRPIPLALLGIPFLLLNPAANAQDVEAPETEQTEKETAQRAKDAPDNEQIEKGNIRSAKEADKRAKAAAKTGKELAKETAERAEDAAEQAKESAQDSEEADQVVDNEQTEESKANARDAKKIAAQAKARARESAALAKQAAQHAKETTKRAQKAAAEKQQLDERTLEDEKSPAPEITPEVVQQPKADEPKTSSEQLAPDKIKRRSRDVLPEKDEIAEVTDEDSEERETIETVEIQKTEPERQAETQVTEVTREVHADIEQRKTRIEGRDQAQAMINDILGAESRISRAEISREERFRDRFQREREYEVSADQRREATTYYQERLFGREVEGPAPEFFRLSDQRGVRNTTRIVEQNEYVRPRYLNEGRRYVHYDSRASIPAVLMAAQTLNHVRFQPTQEIAPIFYERQNVSAPHAMPLPPENYRSEDSWVVSYPVDEKSMISSQDILFLQGSTQFSDPYSYEVVSVMADAMKAMPEEERFVIEGHASSEGSYESNMVLSQQRAEHIVREIVRRGGVSPYRLLPVGYGESEARSPESATEALRSQDRRVVVFRMKPETIAQR